MPPNNHPLLLLKLILIFSCARAFLESQIRLITVKGRRTRHFPVRMHYKRGPGGARTTERRCRAVWARAGDEGTSPEQGQELLPGDPPPGPQGQPPAVPTAPGPYRTSMYNVRNPNYWLYNVS